VARAALAQDRHEILATDVAGEEGRSLYFNLENGRGRIRRRGMDHAEI
jgi:chemotaxis receptor (MCP) glutamine deamidase CheD